MAEPKEIEDFLKKVFDAEGDLDERMSRIQNLARNLSDSINKRESIIPVERLIMLRRKLATILKISYPI